MCSLWGNKFSSYSLSCRGSYPASRLVSCYLDVRCFLRFLRCTSISPEVPVLNAVRLGKIVHGRFCTFNASVAPRLGCILLLILCGDTHIDLLESPPLSRKTLLRKSFGSDLPSDQTIRLDENGFVTACIHIDTPLGSGENTAHQRGQAIPRSRQNECKTSRANGIVG